MYQNTTRLAIGNGDADGFIQRVHSDLTPLVEAAAGFIAYTVVKIDDQTVVATRLFKDAASLASESQSTMPTASAIASDFQVTTQDVIVDSDVNIGVANVLTEEFQI